MNKYTDEELKENLKLFSRQAYNLMEMIDHKDDPYLIRIAYKKLKDSIREEAHRCDLSSTRNNASDFEKKYYIPSVFEAAAEVLRVSTNAVPNQAMFSAVETCHYKLHKYYRFKYEHEDE